MTSSISTDSVPVLDFQTINETMNEIESYCVWIGFVKSKLVW
jgi:hypothetical protein